MSWTSKFNPVLGIIEITHSGPMTATEMKEATSKSILLGKEADTTRFLIDASEMILAASVVDILKLPAEQYEKEGADRRSRVAVILPRSKKEIEAVQFYETACRNRGWFVMLFTERQSAVDWLLGNTGPHKPDV
jgi:hypothetical protein